MAIFRGNGGAGDATGGVTLNTITQLTLDAENSATEAATSASNAATSATSAANSASAASTSATNSSNSATAAATSATNSANSATASASSASAAASSASAAASSASDAQTAQTAAEAAESNASTSASAAASSASSASSSASTATTQATNAASSASAAATSATNAANSATTASGYVSDAADQVTLATTQATNAANSATSASTSASSAASSAAAAASSLDSFDDRYLGAKSSAPTLDNDGNALITGALYYNTTEGLMFVYDGGQWIAASSASQAILTVYKYTATSGQTTFSGVDDNAATLGYTAGSIIVTLNGVFLESGDDYTATNGSSVVLSAGATTSDEVNIYSFNTFDVANVQVIGDARYVRLSTDQTVAGTKTLSSNPVLSAGTANGVTYLNGSKVLTSGSGLTFSQSGGFFSTTFNINSLLGSANYKGGIVVTEDDAAFTLYGGSGYKLLETQGYSTPSSLKFYASNAEAMRLTSTGLGIGTSSPGARLQVTSAVSGSYGAIIYNTHATGQGLTVRGGSTSSQDAFNVQTYDGGTSLLTVQAGGNVGIGTSSPAAKFQVDSSSATYSANIRVRNSNFGNGVVGAASGILTVATDMSNIAFYTGSNYGVDGTSVPTNERMRIDSSGNVGIGTSAPTDTGAYGKALDVQGSGGSAIYVRSTTSPSTNYGYVGFTSGAGNLDIWNNPAGAIRFYNNGSERARIDSSGNLLVGGTTSPSGSGNIFVGTTAFIGTTNADPTFNRVNGMQVRSDGRIFARAVGSWDMGISGTSGAHIGFYTDNGARVTAGNITSNGSTTTYATSSDYRMKTDVQPMTGALEKVLQLAPVTYKWVAGLGGTKEAGEGFIAHELQEVCPDAVIGEKDAVDAEGNPKYQGIDTSFLVATLTAAIQEQQEIIDSLKARLDAANL